MTSPDDDQTDIGDAARGVIAFFEGALFKIIVGVLIVIGITVGLATGFDFSGRVPAPNSQVSPSSSGESPWDAGNIPREGATREGSAVQRRSDASGR